LFKPVADDETTDIHTFDAMIYFLAYQ